jgi:hypothetical protein
MANVRLAACPSCARHVRLSEATCPFCAHALPAELRAAPAPRPPPARLSRNGLYVFGVASVALSSACGGEFIASKGSEDAQADAVDDGSIAPLYGLADAGPDHHAWLPPYGISPPIEAGPVPDAQTDGHFAGDAGYGGPAFDGGADGEPSDTGSGSDVLSVGPAYGIAPPYGVPPHNP